MWMRMLNDMRQVAHIGTYALPETGGRAAHIAGYGRLLLLGGQGRRLFLARDVFERTSELCGK